MERQLHSRLPQPVSYTHLDVYKRQLPESVVIVTVVPSIDLMAPTCFSTALGEAACWFDRAPTEGAKKLPQAVSVEIAQMANSNLVFLNQSI